MKRLVLAVLALAAVLVAGLAGAAPAPTAETGARALVVSVTVPGGAGAGSVQLLAPPTSEAPLPSFAFPEDGSLVRIGSGTASAAAQPGLSASAQGATQALGVSLLGGEIVAESVVARATAAAGAATATADVGASAITGLVVLGQPVTAAAGTRLPLADWGTLDLLSGTAATTKRPERKGEASLTALRLRLTADHAGLPAGTEVAIGVVGATATVPAVAAAPPPKPRPKPAPKPPVTAVTPPKEPGRSLPGAPDELVRPVPDGVAPRLSTAGYVFPVWGPAGFGDSFGAFRGDVPGKWHHGEDIFAPHGTPLLAVASGTLFNVGWNDIGGWRVWLRDAQGNQFYYAHLSAYAPVAVEGGTVRAGDVIGFMGKTGDAEFSPPHLHFEIHPASMLHLGYDGVVAPYPYLLAWRRAQDISFDAGRAYLPDGSVGRRAAPPAAAVLLEADDISATSGLVPGALERTLRERP